MEAYEGFAEVYDLFMDNIPYKDWCEYVAGLLKDYGINDGLVLDLGCGTGSLTELLSERGYDMIGVDSSEDMLQIAMDKRAESGNDILYLMQDMREFELYGTVRAVISICDCMNYILEQEELTQVFKLVNNYLDPGGIFVFDLNTVYKYETLMGDSTIAEDREECSFIWDNFYDKETGINEYGLSLFIRQDDDLYRKHTEYHYQRAYTMDEIKQAIKDSGMEFLEAYDAFTRMPVKENSERIYIVAREHGKEI
ncbi:MAG: class I SAM-dependent methyltransferase [Clostridiales bacterium]|nr:class I SAM-dependent methyltransferase [Clostridiales bacterium]